MPKLLQINTTVNTGSTGRIAEDIGKIAIGRGWDSWIAYGRGNPESSSNLIRIGNDLDMHIHGLGTRLFDNHGLASRQVTKKFLRQVEKISPDIIHLHNIHGYYINYPLLFDFLKKWGGPVVWTLHDCWPFTGHCAHYAFVQCNRWKIQCHNCIQTHRYPATYGLDRSKLNYLDKRNSFRGLKNLQLVSVSNWLKDELSKSFLKDYPAITIYNGIDLSVFQPSATNKHDGKKIVLGVASVWDERKGLDDFIKLRKVLPEAYDIMLVGLNKKQLKDLPDGIKGIMRTDNIMELVQLYSDAAVYFNASKEETLGMTTLEALSCGTPAIVYNYTACPEVITPDTGFVVDNIQTASEKIKAVLENSPFSENACRERVINSFDKNNNYLKYMDLYESMYKSKQ